MNPTISSISYCPVKSVSFQNIQLCEIKKNLGIVNDRIFAFSRNVDLEKAKILSFVIPRFFIMSHLSML